MIGAPSELRFVAAKQLPDGMDLTGIDETEGVWLFKR